MDEGYNTSPKGNVTNNSKLIGAGVAGIAIAVLGFAGGMQYEKGHVSNGSNSQTAESTNGQVGGGARGFGARGMGMGGFGTVSAISATSITVAEQRTGTSTTYGITSNTAITNGNASGVVSDIKTGDRVIVQTSTSDTKTATSIALNPAMPGGGTDMGPPANDTRLTN